MTWALSQVAFTDLQDASGWMWLPAYLKFGVLAAHIKWNKGRRIDPKVTFKKRKIGGVRSPRPDSPSLRRVSLEMLTLYSQLW